jgi:hypothetical protein
MEFIAYALHTHMRAAAAATQGAAAAAFYKVQTSEHTHVYEIIYASSTLSNDPYRTGADRKTNPRSQLLGNSITYKLQNHCSAWLATHAVCDGNYYYM